MLHPSPGPRKPNTGFSMFLHLLTKGMSSRHPITTFMDDVFKALADANRRRILSALCQQPREAGDLARMVGLAPNAVSFHLKALRAADLVNVQRDGRFLRYSVEPTSVLSWLGHVDQLFPADRLYS